MSNWCSFSIQVPHLLHQSLNNINFKLMINYTYVKTEDNSLQQLIHPVFVTNNNLLFVECSHLKLTVHTSIINKEMNCILSSYGLVAIRYCHCYNIYSSINGTKIPAQVLTRLRLFLLFMYCCFFDIALAVLNTIKKVRAKKQMTNSGFRRGYKKVWLVSLSTLYGATAKKQSWVETRRN